MCIIQFDLAMYVCMDLIYVMNNYIAYTILGATNKVNYALLSS